jgi:hypothetical protein
MSEDQSNATALTSGASDDKSNGSPAGQTQTEPTASNQTSQAASDGAPETYTEFSIPDGVELDREALDGFTPLAKDLNLTQTQAQKLVDLYAHQIDALQTAQTEKVANVRKGWVEGIKADNEIGGTALNENVALAVKALDKYGTPELRKALDESGLGDHPEMVRVFYRIGRAMAEDTIEGGQNTAPKGAQRSAAEILYPNQGNP